jgi:hypothetical protein
MGFSKLAKVNGYGFDDTPLDSWIAYHSSYESPLELLLLARSVCWETRLGNPRVCWVNRYDWGSQCANPLATARALAKIDPESGWAAANERDKRLRAVGKYTHAGHPDYDRWPRLSSYDSDNIFLVDAANGPEVLKVLARSVRCICRKGTFLTISLRRPSELDVNVGAKKASSLFAGDGEDSFGCNLPFLGEGWEFARLIFSEEDSTTFPGEKELVGFWYDQDNRYNDCEDEMQRKLKEPAFEII